ncbi:MAG: N-acetyltransferase DgcN [Alphaproteobacteria bacterium]
MQIEHPYLMFLGDARDQLAAKTSNGVAFWRPEWCLGQFRLPGCKADVRLPDMTIAEAAAAGVRTMIVGVTNQGGYIEAHWAEAMHEALDRGLDLASGLHAKLSSVPGLAEKAERLGRALHDVRHPTQTFDVGRGHKRTGKRLLTVGTDTSVGKMFTSLSIEREMKRRGLKATFRATGQTGIFIAGEGVSVDAVVADFISGATEWLSPDNEPDHWDIIEGQGSIFHAAYAGVTLGLIHGSQPDVVVLCHDPGRPHMRGTPAIPIHSLRDTMAASVAAARLTNKDCRCVGVAINTSRMSEAEARDELARASDETGLPAVDPVRMGVAPIVDAFT